MKIKERLLCWWLGRASERTMARAGRALVRDEPRYVRKSSVRGLPLVYFGGVIAEEVPLAGGAIVYYPIRRATKSERKRCEK